MCLQWALTEISTLKQYDHPNSEKAHPLSCSEAPTFPLGSLLPTQRFSWCISISPPSFVTLVWIFLPPLTEKSSEPRLESLRSVHTFSQTARKSLNMNYQAESAPCHSEFFSGVAAVFTFVLNAFLPILFQSLAFPVALLICSCHPLHSEEPSVSVWIKSHLALGLVAGGPSGCCYVHRFHLFEKWHFCLKWMVASKACILLWDVPVPSSTFTQKNREEKHRVRQATGCLC